MSGTAKDDAVSRLTDLAEDLSKVYPQAGDKVAEAVAPVNEAIGKIGLTLNYTHYAEDLRDCLERGWSPENASGHPFVFAEEEEADGGRVEYALCAARGGDRVCRLYVSVCRYRQRHEEYEDQDGHMKTTIVVDLTVDLRKPKDLALPIRVRILDVLDGFVDSYEQNVRKERKNLLNGSVVPKPSE